MSRGQFFFLSSRIPSSRIEDLFESVLVRWENMEISRGCTRIVCEIALASGKNLLFLFYLNGLAALWELKELISPSAKILIKHTITEEKNSFIK